MQSCGSLVIAESASTHTHTYKHEAPRRTPRTRHRRGDLLWCLPYGVRRVLAELCACVCAASPLASDREPRLRLPKAHSLRGATSRQHGQHRRGSHVCVHDNARETRWPDRAWSLVRVKARLRQRCRPRQAASDPLQATPQSTDRRPQCTDPQSHPCLDLSPLSIALSPQASHPSIRGQPAASRPASGPRRASEMTALAQQSSLARCGDGDGRWWARHPGARVGKGMDMGKITNRTGYSRLGGDPAHRGRPHTGRRSCGTSC